MSRPCRVVFALKETDPEQWLHSGGGDFVATLKPPDVGDLTDKIIAAEATYTHWSLFNRFCLANELLDAADAAGAPAQAPKSFLQKRYGTWSWHWPGCIPCALLGCLGSRNLAREAFQAADTVLT